MNLLYSVQCVSATAPWRSNLYSRWLRNSLLWLLALVALIAIAFAFFSGGDDHPEIAFGKVVADAENNLIDTIEVDGTNLTVTYVATDAGGSPDVRTSKIGSSSNARVSVTLSRVAGDGGDDGIVIVGWKEIQGW